MSLRLRRLANEAKMIGEQFAGHPYVTVTPAGGDPPDRYRVEYRVAGLERRADGALIVRSRHEMEIVLPVGYPRQPAACRMLTPVFHPNIDAFAVCTSDFHAAQETLVDLIVRVGQMICYQKHNVKSPLNAEAALWVEHNLGRLPVDPSDLYPASNFPKGPIGEFVSIRLTSSAGSVAPTPPHVRLAPPLPIPPSLSVPMPRPGLPPSTAAPPSGSGFVPPPPPLNIGTSAPTSPIKPTLAIQIPRPASTVHPSGHDRPPAVSVDPGPAVEVPEVPSEPTPASGSSGVPPMPPLVERLPPSARASAPDKLDSLTVQLVGSSDPASPRTVTAQVGEIATLGSSRVMFAYRGSPARLELRDMIGTHVVELMLDTETEVMLGDVKFRVIGADQTSMARIAVRGNADGRAQVIFWNGVAASQLTLAARMLRNLQSTEPGSTKRAELLQRIKEKQKLFEWLRTSSVAASKWKSEVAESSARIEMVLRRHGGPSNG